MKDVKCKKCECSLCSSKVWLVQLDRAQSSPHEVAVVRGTGERIARRGTQRERKHSAYQLMQVAPYQRRARMLTAALRSFEQLTDDFDMQHPAGQQCVASTALTVQNRGTQLTRHCPQPYTSTKSRTNTALYRSFSDIQSCEASTHQWMEMEDNVTVDRC